MVEAGQPCPALDALPMLEFHQRYAVETYLKVAASRPPTMGRLPMPVPISEISAAYDFLKLHEIYTRAEWMELVQICDNAVLEHAKEKADREDAAKSK